MGGWPCAAIIADAGGMLYGGIGGAPFCGWPCPPCCSMARMLGGRPGIAGAPPGWAVGAGGVGWEGIAYGFEVGGAAGGGAA